MKRIIVVATLLALVALAVLAVPTFAQGPMGGGMMGGLGRRFGYGPTQGITPTVPFNGYGMMGGFGLAPNQGVTPTVPFGGVMNGFGVHGGMMGGYGYASTATPIKIADAVTRAQQYVAAYNNADLKLAEVEEYSTNFYGLVEEKSTGNGAFQILIDKYSGAVYPEMGPNIMWNTKYSPMGGMMGWFNPGSGKMTVTVDQARANAEQFVKANLPNTTVEKEGDTFYGYYNFDVLQNVNTYGMLSVNGYTGAVWYHTWHGNFVAKQTIN